MICLTLALQMNEIDLEGGAAAGQSIRLMMAQVSVQMVSFGQEADWKSQEPPTPNPDPVIMGRTLTPDPRSWHRDINQFYEWCWGPPLVMSSQDNGDWIWNSLSLFRIFTAGGGCASALGWPSLAWKDHHHHCHDHHRLRHHCHHQHLPSMR